MSCGPQFENHQFIGFSLLNFRIPLSSNTCRTVDAELLGKCFGNYFFCHSLGGFESCFCFSHVLINSSCKYRPQITCWGKQQLAATSLWSVGGEVCAHMTGPAFFPRKLSLKSEMYCMVVHQKSKTDSSAKQVATAWLLIGSNHFHLDHKAAQRNVHSVWQVRRRLIVRGNNLDFYNAGERNSWVPFPVLTMTYSVALYKSRTFSVPLLIFPPNNSYLPTICMIVLILGIYHILHTLYWMNVRCVYMHPCTIVLY